MGKLMECGHSANAIDENDNPVCAICVGLHPGATKIAKEPNLSGRTAKCSYCGETMPSDLSLAFFEYRGPGSPYSISRCKCGLYEKAHPNKKCSHFSARGPDEFDNYYCGCRGWD